MSHVSFGPPNVYNSGEMESEAILPTAPPPDENFYRVPTPTSTKQQTSSTHEVNESTAQQDAQKVVPRQDEHQKTPEKLYPELSTLHDELGHRPLMNTSGQPKQPPIAVKPTFKGAAISRSLQVIERSNKNLEYIKKQVIEFRGTSESCGYRFLEDQLTNTMRGLDSVEMKEDKNVYRLYESSINDALRVLSQLEFQAQSSETEKTPMTAETCVQELRKIQTELNSTPVGTMSEAQNQYLLYRVHTANSTFADLPQKMETVNKKEVVAKLVQECLTKIESKMQNHIENMETIDTTQTTYQQPLQLIIEDDAGKYFLDEEALRSVVCSDEVKHRKLVVLSVVGEFRRGKSFLLNFIVRYLRAKGSSNWLEYEDSEKLDGFVWRRDKNRVTTGILIWPEAFLIGELAVILLDTQGTFDMDGTMEQNTFIFALSTLISSIQILNIHERLQLDAFMNLQYFIEFGRSVVKNCEKKAFQRLVMLVRDWKFPDQNEFGLQGGQTYWNEENEKQKNISCSVIECFEEIECFLMPHPGEKVANGKEFKGALSDIDENFVRNMKLFIENIFKPSTLVPKRVGPSDLNAEDLICATKKFIESLQHSNKKAGTLFMLTAEVNHEKMVSTAVEHYISMMSEKIDGLSDVSDIVQLDEEARKSATTLYQSENLIGPNKLKTRYVQSLEKKLADQYNHVFKPFFDERKRVRETELQQILSEAIHKHKDALNACLLGPEFHLFKEIDQRERQEAKSSFDNVTGYIRPTGFLATLAFWTSIIGRNKTSFKEKLSETENEEMSSKFKQGADKTFNELLPRFKEKTDIHLTSLFNEATEIYRSTMKEGLKELRTFDQFVRTHNYNRRMALEDFRNKTAHMKIPQEVRSYTDKLTKWIKTTGDEFKQQNMEKLRVALEKVKLDALASYDQEMGKWMQNYKGHCDMEIFEANHNDAATLALRNFENSQFDVADKTYKSFVKTTKDAIAEKMNRSKEIFQSSGIQQSISLTLQKYTSTMERIGARTHFVKDLTRSHDKAKEKALQMLNDLMDKSEKTEEARSEALKQIDAAYATYVEMNNAFRTQHYSAIYTNFERAVQSALLHYQEAIQFSFQQDLSLQIGPVIGECLQSILQEKDGSKEYSELFAKAKSHVRAVSNDLLFKNDQKKQDELESIENAIEKAINDYKSRMNDNIINLAAIPDDQQIALFHTPAKRKALQNLNKALSQIRISIPENCEHQVEEGIQTAYEKFRIDSNLRRREKRTREGKAGCPVGIDLGTTYSCVSVYRNGKCERIKNTYDAYTTPSVVYYGPNEPSVGEAAVLKGQPDFGNCISGVKRIIGLRYNDPEVSDFKKDVFFRIVNRDNQPKIEITKGTNKCCLTAEEVSAEILREMKHQASRHLKYEVKDAVVTIPAYFEEPQRAATLEACRLAGINVLRLLNEPTAAALTFGTEHRDSNLRRVMVFDFGGGTCDVSVVEVRGDDFVVKVSRGDNALGGRDFDQRLLKHVLQSRQLAGKVPKRSEKSRILYECEKLKRILSFKTESDIILPRVCGVNLRLTITRETFEDINSDLFKKALEPVKDCLQAAQLRVSDIDEVVLAGGSSNMPKMKELLVKFFKGKRLHEGINPEEAIARGAALQAAIIAKDSSLKTTIADITPHSLGIEIIGNVFSKIIEKDSRIPCEHTERYCTVEDFQTAISIKVFQGENSVADANTLLGQFLLDDLRSARKGEVSCDVTFKIDDNGILHVTAQETSDTKTNIKSIKIDRKVV